MSAAGMLEGLHLVTVELGVGLQFSIEMAISNLLITLLHFQLILALEQ